jgi:hypothetical protein
MRTTILLLALAGCTTQGGVYTPPDAAPDAPPPLDAWICDPLQLNALSDGHHNPGLDCLGCHDDSTADGAPTFTVAGTLYDGPSGNNPKPGATVIVVDATGQEYHMTTSTNGNFYMSSPVMQPLKAKVTGCPKTKQMNGLSVGNCNQAGCHGAGDTQGRVYLQLP